MDSCKYELYNKELRFEESNRCSSLVRKKPSNFLDGSSSKWRDGRDSNSFCNLFIVNIFRKRIFASCHLVVIVSVLHTQISYSFCVVFCVFCFIESDKNECEISAFIAVPDFSIMI